jgi:hypothetical protein
MMPVTKTVYIYKSKQGDLMMGYKQKKYKFLRLFVAAVTVFVISGLYTANAQETERRISVSEYRDKMMAGWIGQMAGVGWGEPTEFQYTARMIPSDKVPEWKPEMVNAYAQDDLYVEMTFLRSMEQYGFDVSQNQAGIDFANSKYMLWVANAEGRKNMRDGIAPPNSGHPAYNYAADAIDYQIEADFSGLIAPGLPNTAIALGEKFGRLMNYGDGLYGGQFVGAMYAEAFFEDDPAKIVNAGLKAIPEGSQYAEAVRDVIKWYAENPDNWEATWRLINTKYHENPDYRQFTVREADADFNIDAKLNGAYIVMGLLYGNGDPDLTTTISMRCGQDSDCNPSNAAGILFTTIGYKDLEDRFISALDQETKFSFTEYTFPALIDICEKLAVEAVKRAGGRIEVDVAGEDVFVIPVQATMPGALEQSHDPGPVSDNTFSKAELAQIKGSKIFKFALIFLVLLAFMAFKENWNLKAASIFVPFVLIVVVLEVLGATILADKDVSDTISALESISAALAIFMLTGQRIGPAKWYFSIGVAVMILAVSGFLGVLGAFEGRYVAASSEALRTFVFQALGWLVALVATVLLTRKTFSRLRFNGLMLLFILVTQVISIFLIALPWLREGAEASLVWLLPWMLTGILTATVCQYLITASYLVLSYRSDVYDQRLRSWLKLADNT